MDSSSIILRRRMIRQYTDQPITRAQIDALLEAASRAPSPHNRQPWRFAVLGGSARNRLARAMGDQLRRDLLRDGAPKEIIEADVTRSYERITSAPISLLACLCMRDMDRYPDQRRDDLERVMAIQAVAAAVQNILLRATELGLGACWMCAPLFCATVVSETLHLPADWEPQALITVGYPAQSGKDRLRMPFGAICITIDE